MKGGRFSIVVIRRTGNARHEKQPKELEVLCPEKKRPGCERGGADGFTGTQGEIAPA